MNKENTVKKACNTLFPMGLGVKKTEDRIIIIDFIDQVEDNHYEIISSFAMSEIKAKELIEALGRAVNEEGIVKDEDDNANKEK